MLREPNTGTLPWMDIRRFYVVSPRGERGPFSIEELSEELNAGRIMATQQVRTGMGTMLGTVREVIDTPETMWNTAESGSGLSPIAIAHRRNRQLSLIILALTLVPALVLISLFGVGTTTVAVAPPSADRANQVLLPPAPPTEPVSVAPSGRSPANPSPTPSTNSTAPVSTIISSKPLPTSATPDPLAGTAIPNPVIRQAANGELTLTASTATITTPGARLIAKHTPNPAISGWNDAEGGIEWNAIIDHPGTFAVTITYACNPSGAGSEMGLTAGDQTISDRTKSTGTWDDYEAHQLKNHLSITKKGEMKFTLAPIKKKGSAFIKFSRIVLVPVQ